MPLQSGKKGRISFAVAQIAAIQPQYFMFIPRKLKRFKALHKNPISQVALKRWESSDEKKMLSAAQLKKEKRKHRYSYIVDCFTSNLDV